MDKKDRDRFVRETVEKYSDRLLRVGFAYLKNVEDAEDVVQETFLSLFQKRPEFNDESHLEAWLMRVAINKAKNHLKSGWFKKRQPMPEDLAYLPEGDEKLLQGVMELDLKYRLPIHLYYYAGYSMEEIAQILGKRPATVGTWLARGRDKLRQWMEGEGHDIK